MSEVYTSYVRTDMPSIFFTSTKILNKWESSLYSHLMLIYIFLHLNLLLFLVHNHIHASIFVPILLPFWPWWTRYQVYLLYFQEGTRTKYLAYFQSKSKRPPNSANADLEDRIYIYTHLFLLFLDKVSIYLPLLDFISCARVCLSLLSIS